jgi:sugar phosphate isomerase/epimerase
VIRGRAISNIAWPQAADAEALAFIRNLGFTGVELAPGKSVPGWPEAPRDLAELRRMLADHGFTVAALQAVLFGMKDVELFASPDSRERLFDHLVKVARLAGELGASACVFGAPRQRDPGEFPPAEAEAIAIAFFTRLAPIFANEGTTLAFEANAARYGCRFVTRTSQAIDLVRRVDHPGFRVQIDTGTIFLEAEPPEVIAAAVPWTSHMHISEPDLAPTGTTGVDHAPVAAQLAASGYSGWVSIEMKETPDWRESIRNASLHVAKRYPLVGRPA